MYRTIYLTFRMMYPIMLTDVSYDVPELPPTSSAGAEQLSGEGEAVLSSQAQCSSC